jgi:hypothetical protein
MKQYLFFFRRGLDFTTAEPDLLKQVMMNWKNWTEELIAKGFYGGGDRQIGRFRPKIEAFCFFAE